MPISLIIRNDFILYNKWSMNYIMLNNAACHYTGYPCHDLINVGERSAKNNNPEPKEFKAQKRTKDNPSVGLV